MILGGYIRLRWREAVVCLHLLRRNVSVDNRSAHHIALNYSLCMRVALSLTARYGTYDGYDGAMRRCERARQRP